MPLASSFFTFFSRGGREDKKKKKKQIACSFRPPPEMSFVRAAAPGAPTGGKRDTGLPLCLV